MQIWHRLTILDLEKARSRTELLSTCTQLLGSYSLNVQFKRTTNCCCVNGVNLLLQAFYCRLSTVFAEDAMQGQQATTREKEIYAFHVPVHGALCQWNLHRSQGGTRPNDIARAGASRPGQRFTNRS